MSLNIILIFLQNILIFVILWVQMALWNSHSQLPLNLFFFYTIVGMSNVYYTLVPVAHRIVCTSQFPVT